MTVLIAFDGSPAAVQAIGAAARTLRPDSAVVATVWTSLAGQPDPSLGAGGVALPTVSDVAGNAEREAQRCADEGVQAALTAGFSRAEARVSVERAGTAQTLIDLADEAGASVIVAGSHGHGALRSALMGSVTSTLIQHAGLPVLAVPSAPEPAADADREAPAADATASGGAAGPAGG